MSSKSLSVFTVVLITCALVSLTLSFGVQVDKIGKRSVKRLQLKRTLRDACHLAAQHCGQEETLPEGRVTRTVHFKRRAIKYVELEQVLRGLCKFASRHC